MPGGTVMSSEELQKKVGNLLNLEKKEHLAPKALVTPSGETYAMVAPTITKDNFILVDSLGQARRMDVGDSEGHHMPFVVQTIVEDGAPPDTSNSEIGLPDNTMPRCLHTPAPWDLILGGWTNIFTPKFTLKLNLLPLIPY